MSPHDAVPPDEASPAEDTADAQAAPKHTSSDSNVASPILQAPPPAAASPNVPEPSEEVREDTQVHNPVGLVLRAAVAQAHDTSQAMTPYDPAAGVEGAVASALLSELLAHKRIDGLQVPTPEAQARAKPFFERWVHTARALGAQEEVLDASQEVTQVAASPMRALAPPPEPVASQAWGLRQYPIAQSLLPDVGYARFEAPIAQPPDPSPRAEAQEPMLSRPPAGAPSIRPAAHRRKQPADVVPQELLQKTSDTALMWSEPSGGTSFRIDFSDDLFEDTACIITVVGHDVVATFYAADVNARRLLEAEQRRLQDNLEARGLSRAQVRIVMGAPPEPFAPSPTDEDEPAL